MKVLKSLLAVFVPALLLVSCGFVKTAEDKILEVYSAQLKSQGYQDILDAYTLKAETVNSPERDQYVGKIIFLKADGTEENSLPISCNLSTGQVALKPLIPDDELGRLYRELRDDAPLAMQIAAESDSLAEEEGAVVGSVSSTTTVPSDVEETAAVEVEEPIEILSTDNNGMPMWVYGTWTCKTSYSNEIMTITKTGIWTSLNGSEDTGTYTYENGEIRATMSKERGVVTSMPLDIQNKRIVYGGGYYWTKQE
ncbi:MAG: hypothetical protein IJS75_06500 [Bacteroidales bacterium]|nr:hypothetical protein [Bacteroidales bacterium]